jgi:hypothetical protein
VRPSSSSTFRTASLAALRVETGPFLEPRILGDHVSAVVGVVQAAPARVGGIQGIAGVADRHDQLRPGDVGDFRVDVGGGYPEIFTLGQQVTDLLQEAFVGPRVDGAGVVQVPVADCFLNFPAFFQKFAIFRR